MFPQMFKLTVELYIKRKTFSKLLKMLTIKAMLALWLTVGNYFRRDCRITDVPEGESSRKINEN